MKIMPGLYHVEYLSWTGILFGDIFRRIVSESSLLKAIDIPFLADLVISDVSDRHQVSTVSNTA
jgi:hypothetical protein